MMSARRAGLVSQYYTGTSRDVTPDTENQLDKQTDNDMEAGISWSNRGFPKLGASFFGNPHKKD